MEILFLILILVAVVAVIAAYAGLLGALNGYCWQNHNYIPIESIKSALMAGAWALLIFAWFAIHGHAIQTTGILSSPQVQAFIAVMAAIIVITAIFVRIAWKTSPRVAKLSLAALAINGLLIVAAMTALVLWMIHKEDERQSRRR